MTKKKGNTQTAVVGAASSAAAVSSVKGKVQATASAAVKNAVIFSLVEQVIPGKTAKDARNRLDVTHNAIQLYDTHVNALGHEACLEAVKRFLATQIVPQSFGGPKSAEGLALVKVAGKAFGKYVDRAQWAKLTDEEKEKIKQENAVEREKKKNMYKMLRDGLNKIRWELHGNGKTWESATEEERKRVHLWKVVKLPKFSTPDDVTKYLHDISADGISFVNTYSKTVQKYVADGRVFFPPKKYGKMDENERLAERDQENNWTSANNKEAYDSLKRKMKEAQMRLKFIKPRKTWIDWSPEHKLKYVMDRDHWEPRKK